MEEEKKVITTKKEAQNKIIQKLRNRKIVCLLTDKFREDINNENFEMEIGTANHYSFYSNEKKDYSKVNQEKRILNG